MTFSDYINSLPKRTESVRNRKVREIAEACRVAEATVYNWISKRNAISPVYKKIIAQVTGLPESELFPEE